MKSLYKNIVEIARIGCIGIASFLMIYTHHYFKNINNDLKKSRELIPEIRTEWDSSIRSLNKHLSNLEDSLDKLYHLRYYLTYETKNTN